MLPVGISNLLLETSVGLSVEVVGHFSMGFMWSMCTFSFSKYIAGRVGRI